MSMPKFKNIGVIGRYRNNRIIESVQALVNFLVKQKVNVSIEQETAEQIKTATLPIFNKDDIAQKCDLLIVVGGDGSLLGAAKVASEHHVPVLGINRGTLGFLTDIPPDDFEQQVLDVLAGKYYEEPRFLLQADFIKDKKIIHSSTALNDIVLMPGDIPHMIEFETFIDDKLMCNQRADGLIIATPTGSTAYALSGGGPILHPNLDAIVMVPMFPHKLSSRPIVVKGNSEISIVISPKTESPPKVSCDGQERVTLDNNSILRITKSTHLLRLLHPCAHNYFETLRNKLGWEESKIQND